MTIHFLLFIATGISLIIVPGPDMLYVVGRSLTRGWLSAWYSALGVALGYALFTIMVAIGVGVIWENYPIIFSSVKIAGLAYLGYLALKLLRSNGRVSADFDDSNNSLKDDFILGIITSTLNPKGILFYFSILPQFFTPSLAPFWKYAILYGLTTSVLCLFLYFAIGLVALYGARRIPIDAQRRRLLSRLSAAMLLLAMAALLITSP